MGVLDLEDQLVFYRSYHYNTINVLIHAVFVPTILFASLGLSNNVEIFGYPLGILGSIGYSIFYLLLEWKAGLLASPILLTMSVKTNEWLKDPNLQFNKTLTILFAVGWIIQFIGHGVFEKRAPALLDNLVQALVLAPFFVLYEGLFLLGFNTELKERIDKRVVTKIEEFKKAKQQSEKK